MFSKTTLLIVAFAGLAASAPLIQKRDHEGMATFYEAGQGNCGEYLGTWQRCIEVERVVVRLLTKLSVSLSPLLFYQVDGTLEVIWSWLWTLLCMDLLLKSQSTVDKPFISRTRRQGRLKTRPSSTREFVAPVFINILRHCGTQAYFFLLCHFLLTDVLLAEELEI